jgi:hypothetical protein
MRPPVRVRRSAGWRRALPAAGLLALLSYLAVAVPSGLLETAARLGDLPESAHADGRAALARFRGAPYAEAIERIRETLPADSVYLLLAGENGNAIRFDLAPRRAVSGGPFREAASDLTPARLATLPKWTVIPGRFPQGPRLVETRLLAGDGAVP